MGCISANPGGLLDGLPFSLRPERGGGGGKGRGGKGGGGVRGGSGWGGERGSPGKGTRNPHRAASRTMGPDIDPAMSRVQGFHAVIRLTNGQYPKQTQNPNPNPSRVHGPPPLQFSGAMCCRIQGAAHLPKPTISALRV